MAGINDVDDVIDTWHEYVAQQKEEELKRIIEEEHLKEKETRQFVDYSFRVGGMKTTGTDIDILMPPMTRFGSGNRAEEKNNLINRLLAFFERFFGVGGIDTENEEDV